MTLNNLVKLSNSTMPKSRTISKRSSKPFVRSRAASDPISGFGSASIGLNDFEMGAYEKNFALLARLVDDQGIALAHITKRQILRAKVRSASACAIAQWAYDMLGPGCYPRVDKKNGGRIAVSDIVARLRYEIPLRQLPGQFDPRQFDEKGADCAPGAVLIQMPTVASMPVETDPGAAKRGKDQREASGRKARKIGPRTWEYVAK